ncbi:MAG: formylmethanofuran dehydrogenase subunit E family protein [candidate division WOR-3 bacterium]|nr:formylmethanofuran dehydrogenase subunit E family protein [candidate division WOR-3 bacterium]
MRFKKLRNLSYQDTVRFHGHDGPFLALGYRLGRYLVKTMKPRGIMDLTITVKTKVMKPYTCLLDGLQCSTFATMGKGNLFVASHAGDDILVEIKKGKLARQYRMTRKAWDICIHAEDLPRAARQIRRMPIAELWSKDI